MTMRAPLLLAGTVVLLFASAASAESIRKNLADAADRLEDALNRDDRSGRGDCRHRLERELSRLIDGIDDLRPSDDPSRFDQLGMQLSDVATHARRAQCGDEMLRELTRALADLTDAAADVRRRHAVEPPGPPGPPPPQQPVPPSVSFSGAEVTEPGGPGAVLAVPTVTLAGMQNAQVYFAWHWRPESGGWSQWESLPAILVQSNNFVWNNPYRQILDYGVLHSVDRGNTGRFVVHAGIFDLTGRELGGTDVNVQVHYPSRRLMQPVRAPVLSNAVLPPPPPPAGGAVPPPPPTSGAVPPPPPVAALRDCGFGTDDPGCNSTRLGGQAIDRPTWEGFWAALKANASESGRLGMVRDLCASRFISARQLGALMEAFVGENNKLDMVHACAPHLIDPNNALGLASRFVAANRQREFNEIITSQH